MDVTNILLSLGAMLLLVCLVLSIMSLTVFRNALDEMAEVQQDAAVMMDALSQRLEEAAENAPSVEVSVTEPKSDGYVLCVREGLLCVCTSDGYLIKTAERSPETLPPEARAALEAGIPCKNWQEVVKHLCDLDA